MIDKKYQYVLLAGLLFINVLHAESIDGRLQVNTVYLFNVVSDARAVSNDVVENGGSAGYVGYSFMPWFTIEAGSIEFGTVNMRQNTGLFVQQTGYDISGFMLGLKGEAAFAGLFDLWGSVGLHSWKSRFDYEVEYPGFPVVQYTDSGSTSSKDLYMRLGVTLPLTEQLSATVEIDHFEFNDLLYDTESQSINLTHRCIGTGLEFRF